MTPLLLVIPCHDGDVDQAQDLVRWCGELDKLKDTQLLIVHDQAMSMRRVRDLAFVAWPLFKRVTSFAVKVPPNEKWPQAPSRMFHGACWFVADRFRIPFFWCEPDALPVKSGWLPQLTQEYEQKGKPFMGEFIPCKQPGLPSISLSGCAVYPADTLHYIGPGIPCGAWNMTVANKIMPHAANTDLIQDFFGQLKLPPTFKMERVKGDPINTFTPKSIKPNTVLFHRCKDGSLLKLMKQIRLNTITNSL